MKISLFGLLLACVLRGGTLAALEIVTVDAGVYAIVGDLGNRSPANLGNNATFGLVVTPEGAVLVDPGGSYRGARAIHDAIRSVTDAPVRIVINTGGQDHRWLGNGYFRELGAEIIASRAAVADQQARERDQYGRLLQLIGEKGIEGTEPARAERLFEHDLRFEFGGTAFEIMHRGPAHTPGEALVWLPRQRVVFTGDVVYTERMLGVIGVSDSRNWLAVFEAMAALDPQHVVPGHGNPTTLAAARRDTYDYLVYLRSAVRDFMDAGGDISEISAIDQDRFARLRNFATLSGRNAQRVFEELEWE
ncbi:MAG: MBL fold metallo-hydrolase [Gammaproteobacteria bacterium]|nr:MBL fold metallo-hydrolase [Gammaproteobacteria bacterium]